MSPSPHPGVRVAAAGSPVSRRPGGLADLGAVALPPVLAARAELACAGARGSPVWVQRARREVHDLFALSLLAPRLTVLNVAVEDDLRALLGLEVPVPCRPPGSPDITLEARALLGLVWPSEVLRKALAGWSFVQVLMPRDVYLPNVSATPEQALCLGTVLPIGIGVRDLVLGAYSALAGQSMQADERDPAGVLNVEAARFYQQQRERIPFTRLPFLGNEGLGTADGNTKEVAR